MSSDKCKEIHYNVVVRLKVIRQQKNIKQKDLADAIGVSPSLVSKWEKGTRQLDLSTAFQISRYLEVTLDELMVETDPRASALNMDQVTLFDFDSYKKTKYFIVEVIFIASIFLIPFFSLMSTDLETLYIAFFGAILIASRVLFIFFAPRRHVRYLMQSVQVEHVYKLKKEFNVSYHYTQQILYSFSMFILQIFFVFFAYTIFAPFNDPTVIIMIGLWWIMSFFFFGYLLITSTIRHYPKTIKYHITNFRFRDSRFHLIRLIILFQNVIFYVFVVGLEVTHGILRLTIVISVFLQLIALFMHLHNSDKASAYEFDIK